MGAGSYLGDSDDQTDALYREGIQEAVRRGVNLLDTAINYRCQRSERCVGQALAELIESGQAAREELILCTKGGYLPFDGEIPSDPEGYFTRAFLNSGLLKPEEIAQGCHAMAPRFLEDQLNRSLDNLGVETIELDYLHNPETQLAEVSRADFQRRLKAAFEFLEKKVSEGKIRMYGTATWSGYRVSSESRSYLSLQEIQVLAREVGGPRHHFKAVQLPVNLAMPEAWIFKNQGYAAASVSFLEAAQKLGMTVIASGALLQGQLVRPFPPELMERFGGLAKPSHCALQFARSVPGVVTALVGMKRKEHVRENLELAAVAPMSPAELDQLFQTTGEG